MQPVRRGEDERAMAEAIADETMNPRSASRSSGALNSPPDSQASPPSREVRGNTSFARIVAPQSLGKRYLAKVATNVVGLGIGFISLSVVPRTLGPTAYGSFDFLVAFFQNASGLWDMGSSTAFFTKLSRRNHDRGLLRFYVRYALAVAAVVVAGVLLALAAGLRQAVWPGQTWPFIVAGAVLGYLTWAGQIARRVTDAFGLTVSGELAILALRTLGAAIVIFLFLTGSLTLTTMFLKEQVVAAATLAGLTWIAYRYWTTDLQPRAIDSPPREVGREFWEYCNPLVAYSLFGVVATVADRWILQRFGGSTQQGFFGLASRVATVNLLFGVAMTQLLQREFSLAHDANDLDGMRYMFRRYIPLLYTVTAFIAAFVCIETPFLVRLMGGEAFMPAVPATMLMALYPVHQTYGQLSGSLFYATDRTRLYRDIGIAQMAGGLVLTWVTLAPRQYGGLSAGSQGLAAKMLLAQFVGVNIQLWFNVRQLQLKFRTYLLHQLIVIALFLLVAAMASRVLSLTTWPATFQFWVSGLLYAVVAVSAVVRWPELAGLSKEDVRRVGRFAWRKGTFRCI